ncbi:hypothetical protein [Arenimonas sp. MALMAid1274]|uniref:hypothetical protein n=1 Tax=Arenimonas sp. MALMAid1274 TaxID=3411630 RepID=UPI003B9FFD4D
MKAIKPIALLLAALTLTAAGAASAGHGDRVENRLDRRGDRIEHRLDQRGDRIDRRLDRRADIAAANGRYHRAARLDLRGDRIDRRLDRRGERIDHRLDRRGARYDRRH